MDIIGGLVALPPHQDISNLPKMLSEILFDPIFIIFFSVSVNMK